MTNEQIAEILQSEFELTDVMYKSADNHAVYFDAKFRGQVVEVKVVYDENGRIDSAPEKWHVEEKKHGSEDWYEID